MTATERFKTLFANYVERVCVLEAELEETRKEVERLRDLLQQKEGSST